MVFCLIFKFESPKLVRISNLKAHFYQNFAKITRKGKIMLKRIIIGVCLFAALILVAWLDIFWLNFAIFAAIVALAVHESLKLWGADFEPLVLIAVAFFTLTPFGEGINDVFKVILLNLATVAAALAYTKSENLNYLLPFIYPAAPIFMMFALYQEFGMSCLVWLIFTVVACDSGAYFVGKMIGKHPFSASSPNKTFEGVVGGLVLGAVLGTCFGWIFVDMSSGMVALTAILVAIFGVFGDLFESYLKRRAGVKDTSHLLGEHGGVLDRIDGYLFGVIAMFLALA